MRHISLVALVPTFFALSTLCNAQSANANVNRQPKLTPQQSDTTNGLIAVSPVNSRVVWASGRNGTFTKTIDGGKTWHSGVVAGAETLQFRDVQGVSDKVAYLLSIGTGTDSRIYKTEDGGAHWTLQFQNQDPDAFYDCFAFWTPTRGLAQSDSVNGRFPVIRTLDGVTWEDIGAAHGRPTTRPLLRARRRRASSRWHFATPSMDSSAVVNSIPLCRTCIEPRVPAMVEKPGS